MQPERMDLETLDFETAKSILGALEKVNAWLGGVSATLFHVRQFARGWELGERIRFIDWGTGGADLPRALVRWGRKNGFRFEVVGVDNNPAVIEYAREKCREYPEIQLFEADCLNTNPPSLPHFAKGGWGGFDYALSSLTLHHLNDEQILKLLIASDRLARRGLIMNDLRRSARAWLWIWALTRLGHAHPFVQNDAPLSVRRAFRPEELAVLADQAGLSYLKVKTHFGYRLTLAGEKEPHPPPSAVPPLPMGEGTTVEIPSPVGRGWPPRRGEEAG